MNAPLILVIEDPADLPEDVWQALERSGLGADARLLRALGENDTAGAERVLAAAGPRLVLERPGLLARWHDDARLREAAGPRLRWALWLDGGPPPTGGDAGRGVERLLSRALRCATDLRAGAPDLLRRLETLDATMHELPPAMCQTLGAWTSVIDATCGRGFLAYGRLDEAIGALERARHPALGPVADRRLLGMLSFALAARGDVTAARRCRRESSSGGDRSHPFELATDALLALESGDVRRARLLLDQRRGSHTALLAVECLVLLTEQRVEDARAVRGRLRDHQPLVDVIDDALTPPGKEERPRRLLDLALAELPPRLRLHLALHEFALARLRGSARTAALAQQVVDLCADHGLTWPLRLLSPDDGAELAAMTRYPVPDSIAVDRRRIELTESETTLLRELVHGGTEAQIAQRLFRSVNTVKTQRRALYRKLAVTDRAGAVAAALEHGLLADPGVISGVKRPRLLTRPA